MSYSQSLSSTANPSSIDSMFGKPDTIYHFSKMNRQEMQKRVDELEKSQKAKKKKINPKVINMIDEYVSFVLLASIGIRAPYFTVSRNESQISKRTWLPCRRTRPKSKPLSTNWTNTNETHYRKLGTKSPCEFLFSGIHANLTRQR